MQVVIVKCESSNQIRLFRVPQGHSLYAGDVVLVETKDKSRQIGRCLCDCFKIVDGSEEQETIFKALNVFDKACLNVLGCYQFTEFEQREYTNEELPKQADKNIQECKQSIDKTIGKRACGFYKDTHNGDNHNRIW